VRFVGRRPLPGTVIARGWVFRRAYVRQLDLFGGVGCSVVCVGFHTCFLYIARYLYHLLSFGGKVPGCVGRRRTCVVGLG